ncbi:Dam family site-specific DNA-(adenine-N6)-methyltransferase [Poseidonibacter lekithochrous]|uniref:Dam family site-specific DNA-(adenine-N6)-methyltransferase n=1 Tax=Poseidonibacter lekithochrous TaxID=1904463 RepID=UPI000AC432B7|nr:Dam family site-specific DNA-(adenine-N6)-methyltransferase [Poseidonibacter lekithochrous]QKJ23666.1 type II adenine-specific DNA methyltransferase [Poseidonibacter lekithochrous]
MQTLVNNKDNNIINKNKLVKPILKWAGGKTQLLPELISRMPLQYNNYIEPFFGGGALFFANNPENSILADINPELVNLYTSIAKEPQNIISILKTYENSEEFFYEMRAQDYNSLTNIEKAARTLFLNKTCFNGLYRVNKKGLFNTPYGRYKNPNFVNEDGIFAASQMLSNTTFENLGYKETLHLHAKEGDFIFLDPPYLPIGKYEDFKRYTKEGFYEEDHKELAKEVKRLSEIGCHVILTNSNSPLVYDLYEDFDITVVQTKRYVNSNANKRTGEDIIVSAPPKLRKMVNIGYKELPEQVSKYPTTRYMGSKQSLLKQISNATAPFKFESVLDLFSGSGIVSYMFKTLGKSVITNDYMTMNTTLSNALISNSNIKLTEKDINQLLEGEQHNNGFVSQTFENIYYTDEDNAFIDLVRENITKLKCKTKQALAMSALIRACTKKRPRGIFTYTGFRYNDGRKDLKMSFEEQFLSAIEILNNAVFDNGKVNKSLNKDAMSLRSKADLVYIDPPYYNPTSDNEYVRRYHFVEGLSRDWKDVQMQWETKTKKFKNYPTPFSTKIGAYDAFDKLFRKHKDSILVVSYSSNSFPTKDEMIGLLAKYKKDVEVIAIDYTYSMGNQAHKVNDNKNRVQEYIFIGY